MSTVTLTFELAEDVTDEIFASRVAYTLAQQHTLRAGESLHVPGSGLRYRATAETYELIPGVTALKVVAEARPEDES